MAVFNDYEKQIYRALKNRIVQTAGSYVLFSDLLAAAEQMNCDMPTYLQGPRGRGYLREAIGKLVAEKTISPVGRYRNTMGASSKYKIARHNKTQDKELADEIIKSILPPASLDYYLKNPRDFTVDKPVIDRISLFLQEQTQDTLTVNERAYELFGDEKFFKGGGKNRSRGETILRRLGLTYEDVGCWETPEPFFSFQHLKFYAVKNRNIFIVENKDTFWSAKQCLMDNPSSQVKIDMLIYGEGKKIIASFQFVKEYGIDPITDNFYYFGDLDAEGVNIYSGLAGRYPQYTIQPFRRGYTALLDIGQRRKPPATPKNQKIKPENIEAFANYFSAPLAQNIKDILLQGRYIPQEALSAAEMKARYTDNGQGKHPPRRGQRGR